MYARYLNDIGFFQTASVTHTISKNGQVYFGTRVKNRSFLKKKKKAVLCHKFALICNLETEFKVCLSVKCPKYRSVTL